MRTISTGAGLCVLGVCVLGAAALSSPRLGNSATAASGRAPVPSIPQAAASPQMLPQRGMSANIDGTGSLFGASFALNSGRTTSGTCQDLEPDVRFTGAVHPITLCIDGDTGWFRYFGSAGSGSNDINGDGVLEHFSWRGGELTQDTSPDAPVMYKDEIVFDGTTTSVRYQPVLLAAPLLAFIQSNPNLSPGYCNLWGWRDMDGDGDLDMLVYFFSLPGNGEMHTELGWLENTGFPASPIPNPFDLDHDGHVNTADLSLLLMEFTD